MGSGVFVPENILSAIKRITRKERVAVEFNERHVFLITEDGLVYAIGYANDWAATKIVKDFNKRGKK
jgi:hypothetical protein